MKKRPYRGVVRQQRAEVDQFGPLRFGIEPGADRMLHERIRCDDEERRGVDAERDDPDAGQVDQPWQPRTVATLNDYDVRVVRTAGEFTRHSHPETDELFLKPKKQATEDYITGRFG